MTDIKTPKMANFKWDVSVTHVFNSPDNPFYDEKENDPDFIVDKQLLLMEHEMDVFSSDPGDVIDGKGIPVHVGIDCEYQYDEETNTNTIISYQFYVCTLSGIFSGIVYPIPGKRIDFNTFIGVIIQFTKANGLISQWPKIVYVYAHFMRADITHFQDFWNVISNNIDALRGTVASIKSDYSSDFSSESSAKFKPDPLYLKDTHRHTFRTYVRFIDTLLITPGGQGLDAAGELIGISKLDLPLGYRKSEMYRLLEEQPEFFKKYAIRDAEISVLYALKMRDFVKNELKLKRLPMTIGAFATNTFFQIMDDGKNSSVFLQDFGNEKISSVDYWDESKQRIRTKDESGVNDDRDLYESFVKKTYHGGMNQAHYFGPTPVEEIIDVDFVGAYTMAMAGMRSLDYEKTVVNKCVNDHTGLVCGFAKVKFNFPVDVKYPCLPVEAGARGLYYPLSGISFCTSAEIAVAYSLGCVIEIVQGIIVPWRDDRYIFDDFVLLVRNKRKKHKKTGNVFYEQLWKEIGNSFYGKTAQGLKAKSNFDTRTGQSKSSFYSEVTNPYIASYITGFIRASASELITAVPDHREVYSVTTDGFLTNASMDEIDCSGVMAQRYQSTIDRLNSLT